MKGLYAKYKVEKTDGTPTDTDAQYFVLRLDTDSHARFAMQAYARSIRSQNPVLALAIEDWVDRLEAREWEGK